MFWGLIGRKVKKMGRLIDEDDVMHMITGIELNNGTFTDAKTELRNVKTAYSVEKVVKQIEEMFGCDPMYYGTEAKQAVDKAIDIVKRGGVE